MHVLIIVNHDLTLYNFRREFLEKLCIDGFDVFISVPEGEYISYFKEIGCHLLPSPLSQHGMNPIRDFYLIFHYCKIIHNVNPDLILTYTIKPNIYGGIAASICNIPYISTITGLGSAFVKSGLVAGISLLLYRVAMRKTRRIFFQNKTHSDFFNEKHIAVGKHKTVSGSGVNLVKYTYEEYPQSNNNDVRFLFIGRVTKDKGIDELLEAYSIVRQSHPHVMLELLGNIEEGYKEKIEALDSNGFLISHGRQENVREYIMNCHLVVLPSHHEGMANVLLEAAACGRPIITSDIPGCREALDDGLSGFFCKPKDVDSLTMSLLEFLSLADDERAEMGRKGREKMEREFDRDNVIQAYIDDINSKNINMDCNMKGKHHVF